jgi:hypothetical protein
MVKGYEGPDRRETCETGCLGMTKVLNAETDKLYASIGKRVPWTYFVFIVGGLCTIMWLFINGNSKELTKAEAYQQAKNADQDAIIFELRQDMKFVKEAAISAKSEIMAHREFTEGKGRK